MAYRGGFGGTMPTRTVRTPWGTTRQVGAYSDKDWNEQGGFNLARARNENLNILDQEGSGAGSAGAERKVVGAYNAFDPGAAFQRYQAGALSQTQTALNEQLMKLAGDEGAGRLHTGFYDEDQGEVARKIYGDYNDRMQQAALQTAGMQEQHLGNAAQMGMALRNRYLGLAGDAYNRLYDEQQNKRGGGIGGILGGIAGIGVGSILGPLGSAVGSKLGAKIAGHI